MKFLIDTNVLIPLEPTDRSNMGVLTKITTELSRLAIEYQHQLYLHPEVITDISRDSDRTRLDARKVLVGKYPFLPDPPPVPNEVSKIIGEPTRGTNDWVDNQLLGALAADAVDFLVTEDKGLHQKAARIGLEDRTATIQEAISIIIDLSKTTPKPPPNVNSIKAYVLDVNNPLFGSLRNDYPGFDTWLQRCKLEHRQAWTIATPTEELAGVCINKT